MAPARPGVPAACPVEAIDASRAADNADAVRSAAREVAANINDAARHDAMSRRISATIPKWVRVRTVHTTPLLRASASRVPLISLDCNSTQAAPEIRATASPI